MVDTTNSFDSVLSVIGHKAAGKDEFCRHLAGQSYVTYRLSDPIREEAKRQGIPDPTTPQLQDIGNRGRKESGDNGYWAIKMLELARERGHRKVTVNGVRNPGEIASLSRSARTACTLVGITAPMLIRGDRFLKRQQAGDPIDFAEFLRIDDRDRGLGEPPEGQQVDRCMAMVPYANIFNNAGTLPEFHAWIDQFVMRLRPLHDADPETEPELDAAGFPSRRPLGF